MMEKELKSRQEECLSMRQEIQRFKDIVGIRDARIEVLEAELLAMGNGEMGGEVECVSHEDLKRGIIMAPAAVLPAEQFEKLHSLVDALKSKLDACQGKLTFAELRSSILSLEKSTQDLTHLSAMHKLEGYLQEAQADLATLRGIDNVNKATELDLLQAKEGLQRRDEQIEFLMQVHQASSGYDWVQDHQQQEIPPTTSPRNRLSYASGAGGRAVSLLSSSTGCSGDPVSALEELGIDSATAIAALEAAGGDVDRAVLSLFPP